MNDISPYAIVGYSRLYYYKLFSAILLLSIVGYFIDVYYSLYILLMAINILLVVINGCFIGGY